MGPPPSTGLAYLGISDATIHAFTEALQGVATAGVGAVLPYYSPAAPTGKVATLYILHLGGSDGSGGGDSCSGGDPKYKVGAAGGSARVR